MSEGKNHSIAIILIEPKHDKPEIIKKIINKNSDLVAGVKVTTYQGSPKKVEKGLWEALLARYSHDRGVDVLGSPHTFSKGKVGFIHYSIAKIY